MRPTPLFPPLLLLAAAIALLMSLPVGSIVWNLLFGGHSETIAHLASTVLPEYVSNSLWLCLIVGAGVAIIGVATAWLTAMHRFPGQRMFEWALVLPLAMPAYVMAYVYTDFLQFVGPLQTWLRGIFGWKYGEYWFPEIRSLGGATLMFMFVLYPYVYLLARTAFLERAGGMLEAARTLGMSPWRAFFSVSLPLARPALAAGVVLALMETLADFGTVAYFAVPTFTTGIYKAWFSLGDRIAAAQLAAMLLSFVILLLMMERLSRGRARYHNTTGRNRPFPGAQLTGLPALGAIAVCLLPLLLGFLLPAGLLLRMALTEGDAQFGPRFFALAGNSALLAGATAALAAVLAVVLAYAARTAMASRRWFMPALNRVVALGYAVPGAVIAVGVLIPVTRFDNWF
ncbi:MAG TPA: ABC transporter permease subunit, partial [Rhodocyclaceae bacterium]|nr:ABC transporter permease subunit [Rhodocyclaceae bacterium]